MTDDLSGVVQPGRGLGTVLMVGPAFDRLRELFEVDAVPGTLNVRLPAPLVRDGRWDYLPSDAIASDWQAVTGQAGYFLVRVQIEARYGGIAFQADEPDYPPDQIELVSDTRLREALSLGDGAPIRVRIV
jgi:CTP-dependent riboflavin kinase